jgi:hypothetical protein
VDTLAGVKPASSFLSDIITEGQTSVPSRTELSGLRTGLAGVGGAVNTEKKQNNQK